MPGIAVVTISDRCAAGQQQDTTGPAIAAMLSERWPEETIGRGLVPDNEDAIVTLLHELCHQQYQLILTAGGTGLGPRDVTAQLNRFAWLSRAVAGLCGTTLIVNLPGSERGAVECLQVILPLLPHALDVIRGATEHPLKATQSV